MQVNVPSDSTIDLLEGIMNSRIARSALSSSSTVAPKSFADRQRAGSSISAGHTVTVEVVPEHPSSEPLSYTESSGAHADRSLKRTSLETKAVTHAVQKWSDTLKRSRSRRKKNGGFMAALLGKSNEIHNYDDLFWLHQFGKGEEMMQHMLSTLFYFLALYVTVGVRYKDDLARYPFLIPIVAVALLLSFLLLMSNISAFALVTTIESKKDLRVIKDVLILQQTLARFEALLQRELLRSLAIHLQKFPDERIDFENAAGRPSYLLLFDSSDTERDGVLTRAEFSALIRGEFGLDSMLDAEINRLFDAAVGGPFSLREIECMVYPEFCALLRHAESLSEKDPTWRDLEVIERWVEVIFRVLDSDGSGEITLQELVDGMARLNISLSAEETILIFQVSDCDMDHSLDRLELAKLLSVLSRLHY